MRTSWIFSSYFYLIIALLFYSVEVSTKPSNFSTHLIKRAFYETDLTEDVAVPVIIPTSMMQCEGSMKFSSFELKLTPSNVTGYPNLVKTLTMQVPVALTRPTIQMSYDKPCGDHSRVILTLICDTQTFQDFCTVQGSTLTISLNMANHFALFHALHMTYPDNHFSMQILINNGAGCARLVLNPRYNPDCPLEADNNSSPLNYSGPPNYPSPPSNSLTKNLSYLYNVLIIVGTVAVLIIALLQVSNAMQANATTSHFQYTDTKELNHEQSAFLIAPPLTVQSPSIYDIFRAVQFFVTTALLSIPCLLNSLNLNFSYRGVASELGWTCGILPYSFHAGFINDTTNNKIREGICNISETPYSTLSPPSSGFTNFGAAVGVPGYDLFFMSLWEKWSILKTAAHNIHFLILGGMLRLLLLFYYPLTLFAAYQLTLGRDCWFLLFLAAICIVVISIGSVTICSSKIIKDMRSNREAFDSPAHKIVLGAFYTQYRDSSDAQESRVWFFLIPVVYDFIRAIVIGAAQKSSLTQGLFLLVTELVYFLLLALYKPYITDLMNKLNIGISFLKLAVVLLLLPYSNVCTSEALQSIAFALQTIILGLLFGVMFAKSAMMVKGYVDKKKSNDNTSTT
ncbi:7825_t:CDS:2 [Acaulospora morrowiae]|uniref:7825_t:CDS:1 n=1 Tax=Acaulospora morrowiae TaxID=94023 RepID=A0A9N9CUP6_9GLOM|nr:7825_t:CDS:2 [Acaulospora morrowiae]